MSRWAELYGAKAQASITGKWIGPTQSVPTRLTEAGGLNWENLRVAGRRKGTLPGAALPSIGNLDRAAWGLFQGVCRVPGETVRRVTDRMERPAPARRAPVRVPVGPVRVRGVRTFVARKRRV